MSQHSKKMLPRSTLFACGVCSVRARQPALLNSTGTDSFKSLFSVLMCMHVCVCKCTVHVCVNTCMWMHVHVY